MLRLLLSILLPLLILGARPAAASQMRAPFELEWLVGTWEGGGKHSGRDSKAILKADFSLGGRYVELSYRLDLGDPKESAFLRGTFEGRAFYWPLEDGGWKAFWFDSWDNRLPVSARVEGQMLTADWGDAGTQRGRTIYRLLPDGRLEIVDFLRSPGGKQREFARQTLVRAKT